MAVCAEFTIDGWLAALYFLHSFMALIWTVQLGQRSYPIRIGRGVLSDIGRKEDFPWEGSRALIVSDSNVAPLYAKTVQQTLDHCGCRTRIAILPAGETSKSAENLFGLYREALAAGLDRKGWVLALGGGVVGDLAGFLAGTWLRGVPFLQIPTSLLAMVDSSVGGKTGVNLPEGKNLIGVFYQPEGVFSDLACLDTLPDRERRCGLAEIVKTAAIADESLFRMLETSVESLNNSRSGIWEDLVLRCCQIKAEVVAADERELDRRAILNFGHTLGHALEAVVGYGQLLHGEAISLGMVFAARLSQRILGFQKEEVDRLRDLLFRLGLPVQVPAVAWATVQKAMRLDKKVESGSPRFVLLSRLGEAERGHLIPDAVLAEVWHACGK